MVRLQRSDPQSLSGLAYRQNLSLRDAAFRILEARGAVGHRPRRTLPANPDGLRRLQSQCDHYRAGAPGAPPLFTNLWNYGFNLAWEIDFWGRLRRAITAGEDNLDASVANYDQVLVTMLGDIAQNYVQIRTDQERIRLLNISVKTQQGIFDFISARLKAGFKVTELDWDQAKQNLRQTQAQIPPLEIDMRQASNRLCTLMGIPATDISGVLGMAPIPTAPPTVAIGIPADLVRRRPDVRQAERLAAAQAEQIGIAQSALYPMISINGVIDWQSAKFKDLFTSNGLNGSVGPSSNGTSSITAASRTTSSCKTPPSSNS